MIISFNEKHGRRTLTVGKKDYLLNSGSVLIFGSSSRGIEKEENRKGRISIAVFMKQVELDGKVAFFN